MTFQKDGNPSPIYDGRYIAAIPAETQAPLIQVYCPDFGNFQDDFINKDLGVPAEAVRATARFTVGKASGIYKKRRGP